MENLDFIDRRIVTTTAVIPVNEMIEIINAGRKERS